MVAYGRDIPTVRCQEGTPEGAEVRERVRWVRARMEEAARSCGRDPREILLCAVSKYHPLEAMRHAVEAGVDLLGENRVQEAGEKARAWPSGVPGVPWHLLGHLQRNKARKALEIFDAIQSLDNVDLALALQRLCDERGRGVAVLLEVNISGEGTKTGADPHTVADLLEVVQRRCPLLVVEGLMGMAPLAESREERRRAFAALRELRDGLVKTSGLPLKVLSMGMSDDFPEAIREGSTLVRVGSAIFGLPEKKGASDDGPSERPEDYRGVQNGV